MRLYVILTLFVVTASPFLASPVAAQKQDQPKRAFYPEAPKIPILSKQETEKVSAVIYAIVLDDLGKGPKIPNWSAMVRKTFADLGMESVPLLIEWLDYSANHHGTCPCTILGAKLHGLMLDKKAGYDCFDQDILEFVKARLGKGLKVKMPPSAYQTVVGLMDMKLKQMRKDQEGTMRAMTPDKLMEHAIALETKPVAEKLAEWRIMIGFIGTKKRK